MPGIVELSIRDDELGLEIGPFVVDLLDWHATDPEVTYTTPADRLQHASLWLDYLVGACRGDFWHGRILDRMATDLSCQAVLPSAREFFVNYFSG